MYVSKDGWRAHRECRQAVVSDRCNLHKKAPHHVTEDSMKGKELQHFPFLAGLLDSEQ